jgi:hypothetical protein
MRRKPHGAKGRLASPAQMARLEALLQRQIAQPISFEAYRQMLRAHRHPAASVDTQLAAWEHLERQQASLAQLARLSEAVHEASRARGTPTQGPEV